MRLKSIYRVSKNGACFSKLKDNPNLISNEKEGKIIEDIDSSYLSNRASFIGNPESICSSNT